MSPNGNLSLNNVFRDGPGLGISTYRHIVHVYINDVYSWAGGSIS